MSILSYGKTDIGRIRKINQDSIYLDDELMLYIVADGMGGHKAGDIASQMTIQMLPEFVKNNFKMSPKNILKESITQVNHAIYDSSQKNPEYKGMGTTIVAMLFRETNLYIANVGDSRLYMINNKMLYQLSKDHSLIQEKINLGICSREEAASDKQKNVLVRAVGFEPTIDIDIYSYRVNKHDLFLLCSDGLHGRLCDHDIIYIINEKIKKAESTTKHMVEACVNELVDQANKNGGTDNISAIMTLAR